MAALTVSAFRVVEDLGSALANFDLNTLVVVEQSPLFSGVLVFQPPGGQPGRQDFLRRYGGDPRWVTRYLCLTELFMLKAFVEILERDGWTVIFGPSAASVLADYERWDRPIDIEGFTCPNQGQLYPFQYFMVRRALERAGATATADRFTVPGWCAGAGKSIFACAAGQELVNRGQIDLVLAFTLMHHKINLCRFFRDTTRLTAVVNDGDKRKRRNGYQRAKTVGGDIDVFVLNYDKARHDYNELAQITYKRRVLYVLDEVQHVLSSETQNRSRMALDDLIQRCQATVWPMTASIVDYSPLRYHNLFDLTQGGNPLGEKTNFIDRYAKSVKERVVLPKRGGRYTTTDYEWDFPKLHEVCHRVTDRVQNARKSYPGVREVFPPLQVQWESIQMGPEDRQLYEAASYLYKRARDAGEEDTGPYVLMQRYICNTPEALLHSASPVAAVLRNAYPDLITSDHSVKLAYFLDQVESIAEAGDKVVAFTKWTRLGLHMISRELEKRKIRHVTHYGVGQSARESQAAQDRFKVDPKITLFLSSDAGAEGLNLQEARYVINYEPPYSYQKLMQRINRIHRADSQHAGLTAYIYVTENSIEERARDVCEQRRQLAEATQGTSEQLDHDLENIL